MWRTASLVLVPLVLAGCKLNTDYFSEYRGVNLIGNSDFNALQTDALTPKWQTTTDSDATATVADNYMTWEPSGLASPYNVGPTGGPAYRLEIKNLFPEGDFEGVSVLPADWSVGAGTPDYEYATSHADNNPSGAGTAFPAGFQTIENNSLLFAASGSADALYVDLDAAMGSLWLDGTYRLRLDLINGSADTTTGFWLKDGTGGSPGGNEMTDFDGTWGLTDAVKLDPPSAGRSSISRGFTIVAADQRRFQIGPSGSGKVEAMIVDNIRVVPDDRDLAAKLTLPSIKSGVKEFLPGTLPGDYTFTIQVRDDPTAIQGGVTPAHVPNRLHPSGLTVKILGRDKNDNQVALAFLFKARPPGGWTGWTPLTFQGGLDFDTADHAGDPPALTIELTPTNVYDATTGYRDAGSLLVSEPSLVFNP